MLFTCHRARCTGWDSMSIRTHDFADVVDFFAVQVDTGAELWCNVFDGIAWSLIAQWDGVPPLDGMGNPIPPRDGVLWFDPSNDYAVRLAQELDVTAEPRAYE